MSVLTKTLNLASLCFAFGTNTSTWWGWWASKTEHSFVKKNWMWKQEIDEHIALRIQNSFDVNEVNMGRVRWGQVKQSGVARDSFREIWCFLMRNESWDAFGREWIYFHHWSVRQFTGSGKNEKTPNVRGTKILTERSRWRPRPTYLKSPKLSLIIRWRMITTDAQNSTIHVSFHLYSSRSRQMSQLLALNIPLSRTSLAACCWDRRAVRSQSLSIWYGCLSLRYTAHFPAVESHKF